jgi:hypothetical protein
MSDNNNFAPRAGFAYLVDKSTVVRGASESSTSAAPPAPGSACPSIRPTSAPVTRSFP